MATKQNIPTLLKKLRNILRRYVRKKDGWYHSLFGVRVILIMMNVDIVTDIKDQNGRYIGVSFCYQPKGSSSYFKFHKDQCNYRNEYWVRS